MQTLLADNPAPATEQPVAPATEQPVAPAAEQPVAPTENKNTDLIDQSKDTVKSIADE